VEDETFNGERGRGEEERGHSAVASSDAATCS